ncbi:helix-turn-helix transcriptional regulator [Flavobacterium sp.]|uniref:helix-turn-helix transcriptional regulator n=1 Tax=Flavobacterium sp. TaxID=239 RepID=UPI0028BD534B|nr:helix-turn-helix transcriptional regulator [Flavobacterium sp.]
MKKENDFRKLLGLSQEEAALWLGVSRAQWSMFVSGKRGLPIAAMLRLNDVLVHLKENKTVAKESEAINKAQRLQLQEKLEREYRIIQIKQLKTAKQIAKVTSIRQECFAALEVAAFLAKQKESQAILAQGIQARATATLKIHNLFVLEELQLKKESFDKQKKNLEQKIKEAKAS